MLFFVLLKLPLLHLISPKLLQRSPMSPTQMPHSTPTTTLRKTLKKARAALSPKMRYALAKQANSHLHKLKHLRALGAHRASTPSSPINVALYQDSFGELPTFGIVAFCLKNGFVPHLPVVVGGKLRFAPLIVKNRNGSFCFLHSPKKRHALGMDEPQTRPLRTINEMAMCICPLVAVNKQGVRMGMGGGFYDRTLAHYRGLKVGWCYDFQRVEGFFGKPWDIKMDIVITPSGVWRRR